MKKWIDAARLRTLPLSLSGIFLGTLLAIKENKFDWIIFLLACLTTLFLQILSNYANDYGDGIKGTDDTRKGEKRAVASGEITAHAMKNAVKLTAVLSILSAIGLLVYAYIPDYWEWFLVYIGLGAASVWAAINYTVGENAYGYRAMGDIFVFIFFGIVAVFGTYMLYTKSFNPLILYPASAIGLLSMAVLNLNNMRDLLQDKHAGKKTIPIIIGFLYAKNYHGFLLFTPFVLGVMYVLNQEITHLFNYLFLILLIPAIALMWRVGITHEYEKLDSELKKTALLTLFFAIFFGLGFLIPHWI
ncbi:1,4-dihydroxy-2-naphthoate octaprenyltransferase [Flavobacteriaceae bacterium Ap0902]|nr:1,4-dihydroxy-2-naphthoate octaprenyltransferase [Flavobacteriaceae bacterium Ap0902]